MGVELTCPRDSCKHVWCYKGKAKTVTSCPICKTSVMIKKRS